MDAITVIRGKRQSICDSLRLHTLTVLPEGDPRAVLIFHHGLTEHSGRYEKGEGRRPSGMGR